MALKSIHLFSGAGGGILADLLLGHTPIAACEIEEYPRNVILARQRDGIFPQFPIWDDIRTLRKDNPECSQAFKAWRSINRELVVCGGFPCQNISPSGDRTGLDGEKSGLWSEMARVVREVEPAYVLVENSSALTVRGLGRVLGDLAQMGFDARWGMFGATDAIWLAGTPAFDHERFRIYIKATHPNRVRKLQPERRIQNKWGRISHGIKEITNSGFQRYRNKKKTNTCEIHKNGHDEKREQYWKTASTSTGDWGWWTHEPGVGRVVHGLAHRNDRIKAIGNGQVPEVVALAWSYL